MAQNFATSFGKGLRASIEGDREQRRHGAALDLKRQEAAAARRDKLREQNLKIIGEVGTALSEIRANQGPEAAQKHLKMLAPVLTNLSFGSGIPVDQLGQRLRLAAETGATGQELGTQEGAKAVAAAPGQSQATVIQTPSAAQKAAAITRANTLVTNQLNPTATPFFNPETQEIRSVNEADPVDVNAARNAGFFKSPTSVQATNLGDLALQKGTLKDIETSITKNSGRLQRLDLITQSFDPDFLTFEGQLRSKGLSFKEKIGGDLSPSQQDFLTRFTTARRDAASELNTSLRDASGAAVTPQEAQRFTLETPDFESDSPTQFLAKLKRGKEALRLAQIRLHIIRDRGGAGLSGDKLTAEIDKIPLSGVKVILRQQAQRIEQEIRQAQPGISEGELKAAVKSRVAERFGLLR